MYPRTQGLVFLRQGGSKDVSRIPCTGNGTVSAIKPCIYE